MAKATKRATKRPAAKAATKKRAPARAAKRPARKTAKKKATPAKKASKAKEPARAKAAAPKPDLSGWITHTELATSNPAATQEWGVKVFG